MHMTVRNGKSCLRLGYDAQPGGGFQGMETNTDPQKTNLSSGGGERSSQLQQGWISEYAQLYELIKDIEGAVALLDRLVQTDPATHEAMSGEGGSVARPVAEDTPPPFQGRPRTGARDAPYTPMSGAMDVDWRPQIRGPHSTQAIRGFVAQSEMKRRQREDEGFARRFPGASRLKRVV
jgi:hypothetical protein